MIYNGIRSSDVVAGSVGMSNSPSGAESESSGEERTTSNGTDRASEPSRGSDVDLTRTETKAVNRSKALVYLILLCAAAVVGGVTYFLTSNAETATFHHQFNAYAEDISRNANSNAKAIAGQVKILGTTLTSTALSDRMAWPNVSLPYFDLHAREAEKLAGIELLVFSPIVPYEEKEGWEEYAWTHQGWIQEDLKLLDAQGIEPGNITRHIYSFKASQSARGDKKDERRLGEHELEAYVPVWQLGPVPSNSSIINLDLNTHPSFSHTIADVVDSKHEMLSDVVNLNFLLESALLKHTIDDEPRSYILQPVMDSFSNSSKVVGVLAADLKWRSFFVNMLPSTVDGIQVIVYGTCDGNFSYLLSGSDASFLDAGVSHDHAYEDVERVFDFAEFARYDGNQSGGCSYTISVRPTQEFESTYHTNTPALYTAAAVMIFCVTAFVFALYDYMVHVRQRKLHAKAKRTNQIVTSMFPKEFQDRILEEAEGKFNDRQVIKNKRLREVLADAEASDEVGHTNFSSSKPIADLYSDVTLMFADVVGFTSWSSMRDPSQVFILLETIFHEFDAIAHRRKVFKVETVGDCYVAVCGLPEYRKDHAVVMARFARDCLVRFALITRQLDNVLGPDTSDLGMRFGLHSGPVTAGVLRGDRARFQLFGDSMNTCSRVETTGEKNKIHISIETADRLASQGKGHWVIPREDRVMAKGKGELATCWLVIKGENAQSSRSGASSESGGVTEETAPVASESHAVKPPGHPVVIDQTAKSPNLDKKGKLAHWNAEILVRFLKEIAARRVSTGTKPDPVDVLNTLEKESLRMESTVLEEVTELVHLPDFDRSTGTQDVDPSTIELPVAASDQLRDYVLTIANLYRDNSFHSFEHASHVTMAAVKLLSRIVAPDIDSSDDKDLHDHTYGIASDPLTQFAVVLSALLHDLDHTGVPNSQLVKEQSTVAAVYKNRSVAEQNAVDIAWDLLMQPEYEDLRRVIYVTEAEFRRFRQLLINLVMATDIMDKDLGHARKARWIAAFAPPEGPGAEGGTHPPSRPSSSSHARDLRASIVLEHAIQASDVSHTMQHWTIFRKWNTCLFEETYRAYRDGRSDQDPAEKWYEGELGFFDFYIIPLAKKLKDCGVFGVSSDEYLDYAQRNRREWESKGREIVQEMVDSVLAAGKKASK